MSMSASPTRIPPATQRWPEWSSARSWAQVFLKYLLANGAVNCVIPGTDKAEYMTDT